MSETAQRECSFCGRLFWATHKGGRPKLYCDLWCGMTASHDRHKGEPTWMKCECAACLELRKETEHISPRYFRKTAGRLLSWRDKPQTKVERAFIRAHQPKTKTCKYGHRYTPSNTFRTSQGAKACIACRRLKWRAEHGVPFTGTGKEKLGREICAKGLHRMIGENLRICGDGSRLCKACERDSTSRRYYAMPLEVRKLQHQQKWERFAIDPGNRERKNAAQRERYAAMKATDPERYAAVQAQHRAWAINHPEQFKLIRQRHAAKKAASDDHDRP